MHDSRSLPWAIWAMAAAQAWLAALSLVPPTRGRITDPGLAATVILAVLAVLTVTALSHLPSVAVDLSLGVTVLTALWLIATQAAPQTTIQMGTGLVLLTAVAALLLPAARLGPHVGVYAAGYLIAATTDAVLGSAVMALTMVACMAGVAGVVASVRNQQWGAERLLIDATLHDPVTGALSSRATADEAALIHALAARRQTSVTAVMLELDDLGTYNDAQGRDAGDRLLREVAGIWRGLLRTGDVLGRVGGDEFLLLLPDTDVYSAGALLTRLREAHPAPWTFSVAQWQTLESYNDLVSRVSRDLRRRRSGRRRVRGRADG